MQTEKIVFWGAGYGLKTIIEEVFADSAFIVVGVIDVNPCAFSEDLLEYLKPMGIKYGSPELLYELNYDRIVVTAVDENVRESIEKNIFEIGVKSPVSYRDSIVSIPKSLDRNLSIFPKEYIGKCVCLDSLISNNLINCNNDFEQFFFYGNHRKIHKGIGYFDIYDRYFSKYRGKTTQILEIGVQAGGSLQMWKDYFGPEATVE
jgi:hypothetical protein